MRLVRWRQIWPRRLRSKLTVLFLLLPSLAIALVAARRARTVYESLAAMVKTRLWWNVCGVELPDHQGDTQMRCRFRITLGLVIAAGCLLVWSCTGPSEGGRGG